MGDDHPDPVVELRRLHTEAKREYLPLMRFLPNKARPAGVLDWKLIDEAFARAAGDEQR